jgi:hypothetical protein
MMTIAASPRAFKGHFGVIQNNAIHSWLALHPKPQVILFGNEEGTATIALELGICHIPDPACSEYGTPLLSDIIETTRRRSVNKLLCYVNADILLLEEWSYALQSVMRQMDRFLVVARRLNINIAERINFEQWNGFRKKELIAGGGAGPNHSIDVFVFPRETYRDVPPFSIGRPWFDQWFIKAARVNRMPVVDVTRVAQAIHQNHDYSHVKGGLDCVLGGEEAEKNLRLYGEKAHRFTLVDATHELTPEGKISRLVLRKPVFQTKRFLWDIFINRTSAVRHRLGLPRRTRVEVTARWQR